MTRTRWILVAAGAAFVALVACALWPSSEKPYFDYVAERRAAGRPTTLAEVAGPMPPDAENGAPELQQSCDELLAAHGRAPYWSSGANDETYLIPEHGAWPDGATTAQIDRLRELVERVRPWSAARDAALAKPRIAFPQPAVVSEFAVDQAVKTLQNLQRVMCNQAMGEDDPRRRLDACRAQLALGAKFEPQTLIQEAVAVAILMGGVSRLRHDVESGTIDAADARRACDALLATPRLDDTRRVFEAWSVEILEQYRAVLDGRAPRLGPPPNLLRRLDQQLKRIVERLRGEALLFELEPGMASTVVTVARAADSLAPRDVVTLASADVVNGLDDTGTLHRYALDRFVAKVARTMLRCAAARRLARVGLALAEHRARHGDFPASLDDLKWALPDGIPLDPFTGAPFVYERTAAGVRVSSAGRIATEAPVDPADLRDRQLAWELKR